MVLGELHEIARRKAYGVVYAKSAKVIQFEKSGHYSPWSAENLA